jgi:hypothetical protein
LPACGVVVWLAIHVFRLQGRSSGWRGFFVPSPENCLLAARL